MIKCPYITIPPKLENRYEQISLICPVLNLAGLDRHPLKALPVPSDECGCKKSSDPFHTCFLAIISLWFRGPGQENGDILRHLGHSSRSAILPLNLSVHLQGRFHRNGTSRKVRVVVKSRAHRNASWGVLVTGQQGEDVVLTVRACLAYERQVRWVSPSIRGTGSFLIRIRSRETIEKFPRTFKHLSFIIRAISNLNGTCKHLGVLLRVSESY
mmetsp:Transcript_2471/g.4826  ORF Transcript_2471/g.4826 Transcript_2471/m.4826 type:complete len:213 (+) Transcript_2471:155-793(+)